MPVRMLFVKMLKLPHVGWSEKIFLDCIVKFGPRHITGGKRFQYFDNLKGATGESFAYLMTCGRVGGCLRMLIVARPNIR